MENRNHLLQNACVGTIGYEPDAMATEALSTALLPMKCHPNHVTVCICTYRRPLLLRRLLESLARQRMPGSCTYSIVVADNDSEKSAQNVVKDCALTASCEIEYCVEPRQNIALVRNKALENARGEFIAFIDDDEFPADNWLTQLRDACDTYSADGILGPVKPHFEDDPPAWILKGGFCDRPEHITGTVLRWWQGRTGNVLFRRQILQGVGQPFQPKFGTGGEDQDFYRRMMERGCVFTWCNEAVAYETVPPARWKRSYMLKRALLRGRNSLKHSQGRLGYDREVDGGGSPLFAESSACTFRRAPLVYEMFGQTV